MIWSVATLVSLSNNKKSIKLINAPNNRGRRPGTPNKIAKKVPKTSKTESSAKVIQGAKNEDYTYLIDGIKITFGSKPKTIMIGKYD